MTVEIFERMLSAADRSRAVAEVAEMDDRAVYLLESLFNGQAKNDFGSPYRDTGAFGVGLEAAARLGPSAKSLEPYLRDGLATGYPVAAAALRDLDSLEPTSVQMLTEAVEGPNTALGMEAAAALIKHGFVAIPAIRSLEHRSEATARFVAQLRSRASRQANKK